MNDLPPPPGGRPARHLEPGAVIAGKYRLEGIIGRGGMGSVWAARHAQLDMPVALKFMDPLADTPEARLRFEREAKAAALLRTPHVVQILDHGLDGDTPYIAMELLEGEDLGDRLRRERRLSLVATAKILAQAAKALRRAHEAGVIHRDLKPSNVFLARVDDEEVVKVLDFGVAKLRLAGVIESQATQAGVVFGSPSYMSPEQARGVRALDHRTDLWSLAVIVFRALTGEKPFAGDSIADLVVKLCIDPLPVATRIAPDLPPAVDAFFERAFAREIEDRFPSAMAMAAELGAIAGVLLLAPEPLPPPPPPLPPRVTDRGSLSSMSPSSGSLVSGPFDPRTYTRSSLHGETGVGVLPAGPAERAGGAESPHDTTGATTVGAPDAGWDDVATGEAPDAPTPMSGVHAAHPGAPAAFTYRPAAPTFGPAPAGSWPASAAGASPEPGGTGAYPLPRGEVSGAYPGGSGAYAVPQGMTDSQPSAPRVVPPASLMPSADPTGRTNAGASPPGSRAGRTLFLGTGLGAVALCALALAVGLARHRPRPVAAARGMEKAAMAAAARLPAVEPAPPEPAAVPEPAAPEPAAATPPASAPEPAASAPEPAASAPEPAASAPEPAPTEAPSAGPADAPAGSGDAAGAASSRSGTGPAKPPAVKPGKKHRPNFGY